MSTKNEFFAAYFLRIIDDLKIKIDEFGKMDESFFGSDIEPDGTKLMDERLDQLLKKNETHNLILMFADTWHDCVMENYQEGYPIIDMWKENNTTL